MEMTARLLADRRIKVDIQHLRNLHETVMFQNVEQMAEFSELIAREVARIRSLVPPSRPRYVERNIFNN